MMAEMETKATDFPKGAKFRVVKDGARLSGMVPFAGGAYQGWGHVLAVGDVIESRGFGPGWGSDPGYGVHWTCEAVREARASFVEFKPSGSGNWFTYWPAAGWLEQVCDAD